MRTPLVTEVPRDEELACTNGTLYDASAGGPERPFSRYRPRVNERENRPIEENKDTPL